MGKLQLNDSDSPALQFKGGNLTITSLELMTRDCVEIERDLQRQMRRAPAFFQQTPVILNCERLSDENLSLDLIVDVCRKNGLLPIAVRCAQESVKKSAWALGLGWFPLQSERRLQEIDRRQESRLRQACKVVRGTVRSGQQIYAENADLVIIGSVNEGAEVISDGCVHVWGTLRGRAIAGAQGDAEAIVLCQHLKAELVSIAGVFQTFESFGSPDSRGSVTELALSEDRLVIR